MLLIFNRLYLLYQEENINLPGIDNFHFSMNGLYGIERILLYISIIIIIICMFMAYKISDEEKRLKDITPHDIKFYEYYLYYYLLLEIWKSV